MPGIFGCIDRSGDPIQRKMGVEMASSLKNKDWFVDDLFILDHCLLGTVAFTYSKQRVMQDKERLIACVFRGDIYDRKELCKRFAIDSSLNLNQFIVELYQKEGLDFPKYLNGLFNIAIYDMNKDNLIIANDRYGFYPLFYSLNKKRLVFASEVKAITKDPQVIPKINKEAIPEFFSLSFVLGDKTFFCGVNRLPPANILTYEGKEDEIHLKQYWDFPLKNARARASYEPVYYEKYLKKFGELMKKAVERRVQDRKKVGVFLSGGLDSRVVAAFASETTTPVIAFTFGAQGCLQQRIAEKAAERLGIEHHFYEIPSDFIANYSEEIVRGGDGLIRIRDCHFIALLEKVRKKVETVLIGAFDDLFYGGSPEFAKKSMKLRKKEEVARYVFRYFNSPGSWGSGLPIEEYRKVFTDGFHNELEIVVRKNFEETFEKIDFDYALDVLKYWLFRNYCPNSEFQLFKFVNWYLETRSPFLDNELVDFFAFRLPLDLMVRKKFVASALNYCFPCLSDIPLEQGGVTPDSSLLRYYLGKVHHGIYRRVKRALDRIPSRRFTLKPLDYRDYGNWLRTGSRDYVLKVLLNSETLNRGVFRSNYIRKIVEEHMIAKKDHNPLICDLINFELMNRIFFDKNRGINASNKNARALT